MNINQATDYAFRAVLYLSDQPAGKVVEAQSIAQKEIVPMRFLLKIMPSLIKAGIVKSQRGSGGGYYLAKEPENITLLDVVEAIEGPVCLNRCLLDYNACSKKGAPKCRVHNALKKVQAKLVDELRSCKFSDLLGR